MTATLTLLMGDVLFGLEAWDLALTAILAVGIFFTVALLVVAVFSQTGTVQLSAQREAAIAAGHSDRKTLFENPFLRPLLWLLLSASYRLSFLRFKSWLRRTLVATGNPNYYSSEEYLALAMFSGLMLGLSAEVLCLLLTETISLIWLFMGLSLGFFLTIYQLHSRARKRLSMIAKRVPYALDLIALAMGAGATFTEAVRTVAREDRQDAFNIEMNALLTEVDLGTTRRRALQNLADRVPLDSLRSIIASIIQAEELGTPLGEALHAQASLLRLQRSVRAENAAAVASVRILVPSLLILISVVLMLFAPTIIKFIRQGGIF